VAIVGTELWEESVELVVDILPGSGFVDAETCLDCGY
jgi:hypothetical protein